MGLVLLATVMLYLIQVVISKSSPNQTNSLSDQAITWVKMTLTGVKRRLGFFPIGPEPSMTALMTLLVTHDSTLTRAFNVK